MDVYIESTPVESRIWCVEDGELVEFRSRGADEPQYLGAVFAGRVENVLPGIQAAFLDIGLEKKAFLPVDGIACGDPSEPIQKRIKSGQIVLVQAAKEPGGSKGIKVTMLINLPSRNIVLMPLQSTRGVSRQISDPAQRERLAAFMERHLPERMGAIMRTGAQERTDGELLAELNDITMRAEALMRRAEHAAVPGLLEAQDTLPEYVADNLLRDGVNVHIDSSEQYDALIAYATLVCPTYIRNIREADLHSSKAHELDRKMRKLLARKLWLKSGGNLVIDKTEALWVMDVNSAKHIGKGMRETVLGTNIEAAREVRRQLRLRDIEGMVLVDFIHMDEDEDKQRVLNELLTCQRSDRARVEVRGFTAMGLMEIQRSKQARHVFGSGAGRMLCPYCGGAGHVAEPEGSARDALASALRLLRAGADARVEVELHPEAAEHAARIISGSELRELSARIVINPCGKHVAHTKVRLVAEDA